MEAVIIADRKGKELLPLTDNTCVPLLPLTGKTALEHTLESLVEAGIRKAHIVVSSFADQVKDAFGNGERWGMDLTYSTSRGEESPARVLASLPQASKEPFLILRGDVVRSSGMIQAFLTEVEKRPDPCLFGLSGKQNCFLLFCREIQTESMSNLGWPPQHFSLNGVDLEGGINPLDSLSAYHQANLDAASGRLALRLPGKQTALGLTQDRFSNVHPQVIKQGIAFIGSYSSLHPSVQLSGEVVVSDHVIVDRFARIENTVILPHSYVGEWVELRNAIVRGNDLIRIDIGAALTVSDSFLLADLAVSPVNKSLGSIYNRIAGAILLALSLPFWPAAGLLAILKNKSQPLQKQLLRGNKISLDEFGRPQRTEFTAWQFNVKIPLLKYLPRVLAVISGDLRLVGALPVDSETASQRQEEWEKFADQAPAGLIGPTQLTLPANAPPEEKLMADSFYWAHFSIRQDLRYAIMGIQTVFSRKAWLE